MYNCFIDETLNTSLRAVSIFAHRSRFEYRVFSLFHLQQLLNICPHFPTGECLAIVDGPR
eukprot:9399604-Pyramimonas_sp.AAC.1